MILRTPVTSLGFLIAVMLLQGNSCKNSSVQNNSTNTTVSSNQPKSSNVNSSPNPRALPNEIWGGTGISLEVTSDGGKLDYDCAHGTITEKIVLDHEEEFIVKGFHAKEHGGPVRENEDTAGQPAIYRGSISGDSMSLKVTLTDTDETVGTFALTRGKTGRVRKCM